MVRTSFLWRNRVMITIGVLVIFSLHILSTGVKPDGRANRPSLLLMDVMRPFQAAESALTYGASGLVHDYFDLVGVREQNVELRKQLAERQSERARLVELQVENRHLGDLLELKEALGTGAVAANVIGSDATGLSRSLVLSEGSDDDLRRDMAVVSTEGVVGRLIAVSTGASRVLLIDDHNAALDAFDQRSRARGIIAGVVDDGLTMKYVDRSEDIKPGDTIVTSGMDGVFPRGLLVGQVGRVSQEGPGLFLNVEVKAAVDFRKLEQVLILTQKPPQLASERKG
jgi:rod shape-determining protein MreC